MPNCSRYGKQTCMGKYWQGARKSCGSWICKSNCGRVTNIIGTKRYIVYGKSYFGGHVYMKKNKLYILFNILLIIE